MNSQIAILKLVLLFCATTDSILPTLNDSGETAIRQGLIEIKGKFYSCEDVNEISPIAISEESICNSGTKNFKEAFGSANSDENLQNLTYFGLNSQKPDLQDPINSGYFDIYSKLDFTVFGTAFQCNKILTTETKTTTFPNIKVWEWNFTSKMLLR